MRLQPRFPAGTSHLQRYAVHLNAAEINSSFHRHHRAQTYIRWAQTVPDHFRFSVKVPRELTHAGELAAVQPTLDRFVDEVSGLEQKLGALLVQLPPRLAFDELMVGRFFDTLKGKLDVPCACEPRHASWGSQRAHEVLVSCGIARVAADPAPWPGAELPGGDDRVVYFRWHGQPRKYYSDYDPQALAHLSGQVSKTHEQGASVWVIFDNTVLGHALSNAMNLAELLET